MESGASSGPDGGRRNSILSAPRAGTLLIALLGFLAAFGPASMDMYLPTLPALAEFFATSTSRAQLTLSGFTIGFAAGQLFYGPMSDRFGRKRVLVSGVALYCVATVFCALATSVEELIAMRFVQALGGGAGVVLTRAIVRDLLSGDESARALSLMLLVPSIAAFAGPFVGGQLLLWSDWRSIFWLLVVFGIIALALTLYMLPETLPPEKRKQLNVTGVLRECGHILGHRQAMGYMFCGAFSFAAMFAQLSGTPFIYITLFGVPPEYFGFLFGLNILGIMAGSWVNSRLVVRFGMRRMLVVGTSIALFGGLTLMATAWFGIGGLAGIVVPVIIFMVPHNITNANASAATLDHFPHVAGTASALIGAIRFGVGASVGALVGLLHDGTSVPMAAVIAGCAILSAASFWLLTHDDGKAAQAD